MSAGEVQQALFQAGQTLEGSAGIFSNAAQSVEAADSALARDEELDRDASAAITTLNDALATAAAAAARLDEIYQERAANAATGHTNLNEADQAISGAREYTHQALDTIDQALEGTSNPEGQTLLSQTAGCRDALTDSVGITTATSSSEQVKTAIAEGQDDIGRQATALAVLQGTGQQIAAFNGEVSAAVSTVRAAIASLALRELAEVHGQCAQSAQDLAGRY